MKRLVFLMLLAMGLSNVVHAQQTSPGDPEPIDNTYTDPGDNNNNDGSYDSFHSSLSPYGEWIDCNYGNVWRPFHPAAHWRPYVNGRWVWTAYGWYWSSNEPFGWATYHYGRWIYDDYYGWIWIPDRVWGPAWVEWRYNDDYIGWAPLTPHALFRINIGVTFSHGWVAPVHYWNFVPCRNFTTGRVTDYIRPIDQTRRIFGNTRTTVNIRSQNNRVVNGGIDVGFIERHGNLRINRVDVVQNDRNVGDRIVREGNRERVEVYRPNLDTQTRGNDLREHRVQQQNTQRNTDGNRIIQHNQRELGRTFDRQQSKPQSDEKARTEYPSRTRQFRESEQRFELPRKAEQQRREEQIGERHGRQYFEKGREQQPREEQRQYQGRSGSERSPQSRVQPQSRPQGQSQSRPEGRGRRP